MLLGSGGGAGATDNHSNTSGRGGRGGGIALLFARVLDVDGTLSVGGGSGVVPTVTGDSGNGGGGAGGSLRVVVDQLQGGGGIRVTGGDGPAAAQVWNSPGGDGSAGRARIDFNSAGGNAWGTIEADAFVEGLLPGGLGHSERYVP
jgi:hypothetical protein